MFFNDNDWRDKLRLSIVDQRASLKTALKAISDTALQICFVCDDNAKILGTITDGDVRRALLADAGLDTSVTKIMNIKFQHVIKENGYRAQAHKLMLDSNVSRLPIIDHQGRLIDVILNNRFYKRQLKDNIVVIMAGGAGTRLRPLTENCPKPLLKIGDKPLLEHSILNFKRCGFHRFYISVNYLGHMVTDFLKDGSDWGVEISYLKETKQLGTAGALALLPQQPEAPFLVTNGDIIMQADMDDFVMRHLESQVTGTMCIRQHNTSIPFGVVHTDGRHITSLVEKPSYTYFINAGIYCFNPDVLNLIPKDTFYNMTDLFEDLIEKKYKTTTYLLEGAWIDVGSVEDYNYACQNLNLLGVI